jgi:hypothetical protein
MTTMGRLVVLVSLLAGCRATGTFTCELDDHCRHGGLIGRCEPSRYCSFPDGGCLPSGWRYDDNAPSTHAGKCVGDEFMDAGIDTTGTFHVGMCPPSYDITLPPTSLVSRYRLALQPFNWKTHASGCALDLNNATHLVMLETAEEATGLAQAVAGQTIASFYAGAVQNPKATATSDGWILLDDTALPATTWVAGEPDDDDDTENAIENFAMLSRVFQRLQDTEGVTPRAAICECDGKSQRTLATQYIAGN